MKKATFLALVVASLVILFAVQPSAAQHPPRGAPQAITASVTEWSVDFEVHEGVSAPDGTVYFTAPAPGGIVRLNPETNEITVWPIDEAEFHLSVGPPISVEFQDQTFSEDFTIVFTARPITKIGALLPNSNIVMLWPTPVSPSDITASEDLIWFSQFPHDVASLDPVQNILRKYQLPHHIVGVGGFVHGLSFGAGRLWFGITAGLEPGGFQQRVGALHPDSLKTEWYPILTVPPEPVEPLGIGRAATFSAGSVWTLYHTEAHPDLRGIYRLRPGPDRVVHYQFPLPPPHHTALIDSAEFVTGRVWSVTRATVDGIPTTLIMRLKTQPNGQVYDVSPVSIDVQVSEFPIEPEIFEVEPDTIQIEPSVETITGQVEDDITMWALDGGRVDYHLTISPGRIFYSRELDGNILLGMFEPGRG